MEKLLQELYQEMDSKHAEDIVMIDIKGITSIADYFVIAGADNTRKAKAIADHVEEFLEKNGYQAKTKEGLDSAKWILLDFGSIIVHVFENEERYFPSLKKERMLD